MLPTIPTLERARLALCGGLCTTDVARMAKRTVVRLVTHACVFAGSLPPANAANEDPAIVS